MLFCLHVKSLDIVFKSNCLILALLHLPVHLAILSLDLNQEKCFSSVIESLKTSINNIKLKKMKEAHCFFEKNIFLMSHRDARLVYDEWLVQKDTIINLLSLGHIEEARNMAEPFLFASKV